MLVQSSKDVWFSEKYVVEAEKKKYYGRFLSKKSAVLPSLFACQCVPVLLAFFFV